MRYAITEQNLRTCTIREITVEGAPDAREALMSPRIELPMWTSGQPVKVCGDGSAFIEDPDDLDHLISADLSEEDTESNKD